MRRWNFYIQFTFGKVRPIVLCFFKGDHQLKSQANVDQMTERLDDVRFTPRKWTSVSAVGQVILYGTCDERGHQSCLGCSGRICCECPHAIFLWSWPC